MAFQRPPSLKSIKRHPGRTGPFSAPSESVPNYAIAVTSISLTPVERRVWKQAARPSTRKPAFRKGASRGPKVKEPTGNGEELRELSSPLASGELWTEQRGDGAPKGPARTRCGAPRPRVRTPAAPASSLAGCSHLAGRPSGPAFSCARARTLLAGQQREGKLTGGGDRCYGRRGRGGAGARVLAETERGRRGRNSTPLFRNNMGRPLP